MPNPELEKFRQQNPNLSDKGANQVEQIRNEQQQAGNQSPAQDVQERPTQPEKSAIFRGCIKLHHDTAMLHATPVTPPQADAVDSH